jgi:hypothetical protein
MNELEVFQIIHTKLLLIIIVLTIKMLNLQYHIFTV